MRYVRFPQEAGDTRDGDWIDEDTIERGRSET